MIPMAAHAQNGVAQSLGALRSRLNYVNRAWTVRDYEALLQFYVEIVPKLLDAERCGIFIMDSGTGQVLSKAGTGLAEGDIEAPLDGSIVGSAISTGRCVIENDLERRAGFHRTTDAKTGFVTRSIVCAPIQSVAGGESTGAIQVLNKLAGANFTEEDGRLVERIAKYLSMVLDNILLNQEILALSRELDREVAHFRSLVRGSVSYVAESPAMRNALDLVRMVSATPVNVLIQGENGSGKELIARMIHEGSERRGGAFVAVNCAAIPETLMESEFFGYEKGAFTGAVGNRKGRLEEANGGTLFLDEIGDMPPSMQPKLLRAIQEGEGARLGSNRVIRYDFRVISATNRDLRQAVQQGAFREDLFYRLFAVEIGVPALRERREDIAPLAMAFLEDVCRRFSKTVAGFSNELLTLFERYEWPGNVRQLRHEIERLVALTPEGERLTPARCSSELLDRSLTAPVNDSGDLCLPDRVEQLEVRLIARALEEAGGGKGQAARLLGITRQGLYKKLKRYGMGELERGIGPAGQIPGEHPDKG